MLGDKQGIHEDLCKYIKGEEALFLLLLFPGYTVETILGKIYPVCFWHGCQDSQLYNEDQISELLPKTNPHKN